MICLRDEEYFTAKFLFISSWKPQKKKNKTKQN